MSPWCSFVTVRVNYRWHKNLGSSGETGWWKYLGCCFGNWGGKTHPLWAAPFPSQDPRLRGRWVLASIHGFLFLTVTCDFPARKLLSLELWARVNPRSLELILSEYSITAVGKKTRQLACVLRHMCGWGSMLGVVGMCIQIHVESRTQLRCCSSGAIHPCSFCFIFWQDLTPEPEVHI